MMEKQIENQNEWMYLDSKIWKQFGVDYEAILNQLKAHKIRHWTSGTEAGVRVFISHELQFPFTVYNCGASISIRNEGNETWLDIWKDYSE